VLAEAGGTSDDDGLAPNAVSGLELEADWRNLRSPEIYLGYGRAETFSSPGGAALWQPRRYTLPARLKLNDWALAGEWTPTNPSTILTGASGRLACRFHARDVHLVMGPLHQDGPVRFRLTLDGERPGPAHGLDADAHGAGTVADQRLYQLVRQREPIVDRTLEIEFLDAGVELFAFTFG
jgi:hypothetical protein